MTISELAKRAGVSRDTISTAERGQHSLQAATLSKLARALNKTPSTLLAEEERLAPKAPSSSLEPSLFRGFGDELHESVYSPWLQFVNRYADRWEQRIASGAFDMGAVDEFIATLEDVGPVLSQLGLQEKQEQPDGYIFSFGPIMGEAISRLMGLIHPLIEAGTKQFEESELEQLRRSREGFEGLAAEFVKAADG